MDRKLKSLAPYLVYALLAVAAIYGVSKLYSALTAKKPEAAQTAETTPGEATLDLNEEQAGSVKIEKVGKATFVERRQAVGNIDFDQHQLVQVFSPYMGRIIKADHDVGDQIQKGDVLFTLDSPDLLNAEANLIQNAGLLKLQNNTLARAIKMKSFGGASQQAVDQSTSDQQTAEGNLKSARDAVRIFGKTEEEIDNIIAMRHADDHTMVVKSPVSGYVVARNASPGLFVQPGTAPPSASATSAAAPLAIFTIGDLASKWMFANVPETDAPLLKTGQKVVAEVQAFPGREFEGKVVSVGQNIDPSSRRVFVRSEVADPQSLLRAGMLANFVVIVGQPYSAIAVPTNAVVREGDGTMTVWVTENSRHFVRRIVKLGMTQNGFHEIKEGLRPGEQVVTDNAIFLSNQFALLGNSTD
ncbi:MAG TPA: efflux RND transporter periplasmic adaptor subunit [Roseiarcus sp.]|nr:efflux RND transporter periplasmic adaptor subunit [Roseiarcus sp.]